MTYPSELDMVGIIGAVIAFAAGCLVSAKFWAGVLLGTVVKRLVVNGWAWARRRFNF